MSDIAKLLARCLSNYGERKGVDMRLLAVEWHASLYAYSPRTLNAALSEHIRLSTYWPTIAEILERVRDVLPKPDRYGRYGGEPDQPFARDGRTVAEEITHRAEQCKKWRQEAIVNLKLTDGRKE